MNKGYLTKEKMKKQFHKFILLSSLMFGLTAIFFTLTSKIETVTAVQDCYYDGFYENDTDPYWSGDCYIWDKDHWKWQAWMYGCEGVPYPMGCTPVYCRTWREDCMSIQI